MHISGLKAYSDNAPPFIEDRQVQQAHGRKSHRLQYRNKPELLDLPDDRQSPDIYRGNFIDIYV
jgi:hypothetical protein